MKTYRSSTLWNEELFAINYQNFKTNVHLQHLLLLGNVNLLPRRDYPGAQKHTGGYIMLDDNANILRKQI